MDLDVFVARHRGEWDRLDQLTKRRRTLTGVEADELVRLYQRAATHLSTVQTGGVDPALAARLSSLLARSRAAITGAHSSTWRSVGRFAAVSFPAAVYRVRRWWLGCAVGFVLVAFLIGWHVATSGSLQARLLPGSGARQFIQHAFRHYYSTYDARSFAAHVWLNNAFVAAESVAFGMLLGIPVLIGLFYNALTVGVDGGLMAGHGLSGEFWTLLLPHGMLELTATFLAAAVGLRLGWTVIDPGQRPRLQALAEEGRATITVAIGLVVVLLVSGLIEAFVTPSGLPTWARIGIGGVAEVAFLGYVLALGRRAFRAGETGDIEDAPDLQPVAG